ncbi:aspartate aminotransferase family protein [Paenibacillus tarimensis]
MNDTDSKTQHLLDKAKNSILYTADRPALVMERGNGMKIWDTEGNTYLDFIGGWAVNCLGHAPTVIKDALMNQAAALMNASPAYYNKPMIELAAKLTEISCFDRVFFASSGAEANEGAVKLARKYGSIHLGGAYEIITMTGGFHGRTLAMMSATGKKQWESLFEPKAAGFKHVPLNDFEACRAAVTRNTCAIMLEPIQGEGGVHSADEEYLRQLRQLCDELGILLIFDEIQTGIGRTGKLFAYEHYGIEPDIMTLGKGIGGGFPLSAMLTKERFNLFEAGEQGGTYNGQPLAMAVGLAVVNEVLDKQLPQNAQVQGNYIQVRLQEIAGRYQLKQIRGKGLLLAVDLSEPCGVRLVAECREEGLLINAPSPFTIRIIPPLIVSRSDIDRMFAILTRVMDRMGL